MLRGRDRSRMQARAPTQAPGSQITAIFRWLSLSPDGSLLSADRWPPFDPMIHPIGFISRPKLVCKICYIFSLFFPPSVSAIWINILLWQRSCKQRLFCRWQARARASRRSVTHSHAAHCRSLSHACIQQNAATESSLTQTHHANMQTHTRRYTN